ncbi:hypothetical protein BAAM0499_03395 [Bifidobacterium animalis subsp. animalis MCC 0499]|uniref:hypothetical protein n=1 Tax=Bifidobacterium animalis TaxID=28025 RepID=UPI00069AA449|nr:hypothetical protein [Bifidobacterium animalis]KOA60930.1 hypothetical protein BAAM0499_03395 [Bifidobacterium animalis subsp. animalis MCC 0499]
MNVDVPMTVEIIRTMDMPWEESPGEPTGENLLDAFKQGVVPHGGIHEEEDGSAEYGSVDAVNDINEM